MLLGLHPGLDAPNLSGFGDRKVSFGPCMEVLIRRTSKVHGARSSSASFERFSKAKAFFRFRLLGNVDQEGPWTLLL